jgi:hypothetical protein
MALRWIIENQSPIEQRAKGDLFVVCYEHLVDHPDEWWPRLCTALNLSNVPEVRALRKPSQQASGVYISQQDENRLSMPRWHSSLNDRQLQEIQGMLNDTGFTLYDTQQQLPTSHP